MANRVSTTSRRSVLMGAAVVPAVLASAPVAAAGGDPSVVAFHAFQAALRVEFDTVPTPGLDLGAIYAATEGAEARWHQTPATTPAGLALRVLWTMPKGAVDVDLATRTVFVQEPEDPTLSEALALIRDAVAVGGLQPFAIKAAAPAEPITKPAPPPEPPYSAQDRAELEAARVRSREAVDEWVATRRAIEARAWARAPAA
jgi:hypothetical protein